MKLNKSTVVLLFLTLLRLLAWTATVLNVNANHNPALQKKCKALYDYSNFVSNVRNRIASGQERDEAVKAAVDDAINGKLLEGLFEEQKWEIIGLMLAEFDQEIYEKTVREEGRKEGLEKGLVEGALVLIKDFNVTPEVAAEKMGAPLDQLLAVLNAQPAHT